MLKTLISGAFEFSDEQLSALSGLGLDITYQADEKQAVLSPEQYEAVFCLNIFAVTPIERFTSLRYIQLASAGLDRMPVGYIQSHDISLRNARGVYSIPMAEFAVCGVLQLYKQSRFFEVNRQKHLWYKHRGLLELCGKTVGIIGCGSVGQECAKRFSAFDTTVVGVDTTPVSTTWFHSVCDISCLDNLLPQWDIIILTVPLTAGTRCLLDLRRIEMLKDAAVVVNIARGAVVDMKALTKALAAGHIAGAVLDVFEEEPLPAGDPLWDLSNVLITPHNSFICERNHERLWHVVLSNLYLYKR